MSEATKKVPNPRTKRLGRIQLNLSYVVDLHDNEMVQTAKECLFEDIHSMVKYNELWEAITIKEDSKAKESDISSFLLKENEPYEPEI
jgi:hypothetical protein